MMRSDSLKWLQRSALAWMVFDVLCLMVAFRTNEKLDGPEAIILLLFLPLVFLYFVVLMLWALVHLVLSIAALKTAEKSERFNVLFHTVSAVLAMALFIWIAPKGLFHMNLVMVPFGMIPAWLCSLIGPYLTTSRTDSSEWDVMLPQ